MAPGPWDLRTSTVTMNYQNAVDVDIIEHLVKAATIIDTQHLTWTDNQSRSGASVFYIYTTTVKPARDSQPKSMNFRNWFNDTRYLFPKFFTYFIICDSCAVTVLTISVLFNITVFNYPLTYQVNSVVQLKFLLHLNALVTIIVLSVVMLQSFASHLG